MRAELPAREIPFRRIGGAQHRCVANACVAVSLPSSLNPNPHAIAIAGFIVSASIRGIFVSKVRIVDTEAGESAAFEGFHACCIRIDFMIVAEQMQGAVDRQVRVVLS